LIAHDDTEWDNLAWRYVDDRLTGTISMPAPYCYEFPRPMVTVDLVAFSFAEVSLRVLLVRRGRQPFLGKWAIPGGYVEMDESAEAGARRELREETGLLIAGPVEPIGFFARPKRDPRGRTITLSHAAIVAHGKGDPRGGDDAALAAWVNVADGNDLAFDHSEILSCALQWLRRVVLDQSAGRALELLPNTFRVEKVHALFGDLALSRQEAASWLRGMMRLRRIERSGPSLREFCHVAARD
jgi:8-oxo-dGTP diphosphatase